MIPIRLVDAPSTPRVAPRARDPRFHDAADVADWRLCVGCGACVPACEDGRLQLVDIVKDGLRPRRVDGGARDACGSCTDCLDVCPGLGTGHGIAGHATTRSPADTDLDALRPAWGPVLELWEGHATDAALRSGGSSAGLASVLALHAMESMGLHGVLHVGPQDEARWLNEPTYSQTREQLLARTGSRYAPAAPASHLRAIEDAPAPSAFIGKPCDVQALRRAQAMRPALDAKVGLAIGIFCAGTPSTQGTLDLLARHGIARDDVEALRYRGRGWPGTFAVRLRGEEDEWRDLATYAEAWDFLQAYRPHRCHLCPDGTSEFADVSCGDPWYLDTEPHQPGLSLVVVRTERGRAAVRAAIAAGVVELKPVGARALERSQVELQRKRGAIWARVLTLRALGVPAPRHDGFALFRQWLRLPFMHQARSVVGTLRRALGRGYRRPISAVTRSPDDQPGRPRSGRQRVAGELVRAAVPAGAEAARHAVAVDGDR